MKSIKESLTEKNLLKAFAGESQARNRYTYFSKIAEKEGYAQIAAIFLETAEQERVHAKRMFSYLEGGEVEITASYPAGILGTTEANLREAILGEHEEWYDLYAHFADVADQEGYTPVAKMFQSICVSEREHEGRYTKLLQNIEAGLTFRRDTEMVWFCRKCGYMHIGLEAPEQCPACLHPQAYFELRAMNY